MSTIPDEKTLPKSSKEKEEALRSEKPWKTFFEQAELVGKLLNEVFPAYLKKCRWFGGKSKKIKQLDIQHLMAFPVEDSVAFFVILEAIYVGTFSETYFLPLSWVAEAEELDKKALIAPCWLENKPGYLADALYVPACRKALMENLLRQKQVRVGKGVLHFERGKVLDSFPKDEAIQSVMLKAEQSNTSIIYNDRYFLKIYRHLFRETNPDYETTRFLTETAGFSNTPAYAGSITWKRPDLPDISIGLMQEKVENEGDAFTYFLPRIRQYFEKVRDRKIKFEELERIPPYTPRSIRELDPEIVDLVGYENLKSIEKLAQRTAEMHVAISSDKSNYLFMPIIFNEDYVVWLKNRLIYQFDRRQELAERSLETLEGLAREYAEAFLERKEEIINRILNFDESMLISKRIRIHGDYHLGQVLKQGDDFFILDFEGEPESTIRDRKVKQPPMKDVAGMIRSFHYAIYATIFELDREQAMKREAMFEAGTVYYRAAVAVFLNTYLKIAMRHNLSIGYHDEIIFLLKYHLLEKAIYELGYELNSRPDWAIIPLRGIINLLEAS